MRPWAGPVYGVLAWTAFEAGLAPALGLHRGHGGAARLALLADHVLYGVVVAASPGPTRTADRSCGPRTRALAPRIPLTGYVSSAAVSHGRRTGSTFAACMALMWSSPSSTTTSQPSASSSARCRLSGPARSTTTPPHRSS